MTRFRGARAPVSNFPNKFSRAKENDDYGDKNNNEDRNTWAPSIREAREEKHARNVIRSSSKERLRQTSRDANYAGERRRPCNRKYLLLEIAPLETTSRAPFSLLTPSRVSFSTFRLTNDRDSPRPTPTDSYGIYSLNEKQKHGGEKRSEKKNGQTSFRSS